MNGLVDQSEALKIKFSINMDTQKISDSERIRQWLLYQLIGISSVL